MLLIVAAFAASSCALADGLPERSALEVRAQVVSLEGNVATLVGLDPTRPPTPDMVMTILAGGDAVCRLCVQSVAGARAQAVLLPGAPASLTPPLTAVAPCPVPVTSVTGDRAYVALPADHDLSPGVVLQAFRDGRALGSVSLALDDGSATVTPATEVRLRVGDVCYAAPSAGTESSAPSTAVESSEADLLVTSVQGQDVYLWHDAPDELTAATDRVAVLRNGECIAVVKLIDEGPLAGRLEAPPAVAPRAGDGARPWQPGDEPRVTAVAVAEPEPESGPPVVAQAPPGVVTQTDRSPRQAPPSDLGSRVAAGVPRTASVDGRPRLTPPKGLSFSGPTGIIRVPNAETQDPGTLRIGRVHADDSLDTRIPGSRSRVQFTVGVIPGLEMGATHFERYLEDLTYHGKVQLLRESRRWPSVAVGTMDERAAYDLEPTRFVALGKHFLDDRVRVTLGYGDGGLDGVFGGIEAALNSHFTLLAEYGANDASFGLRATPTPRVHIDLAELGGHLGGHVTYALHIADGDPHTEPVSLKRPDGPVAPDELALEMQEAVCLLGMENVRTEVGETANGLTAVVFYENRRYLHDETEALGRVLAAAARELPPGVSRLVVVVTKSAVPVLRVTTHPDDYTRFLSGELPADSYASMLVIGHGGGSPIPARNVSGSTRLADSTALTADISLTPLVRTLIGSEDPLPGDPSHTKTLDARLSLRPDVTAHIMDGLDVRYSRAFHVAGALGGGLDHLYAGDAAHVSYIFRPAPGALARVAAGDFLGGRRGGVVEGAMSTDRGRMLFRGVAGHMSDRRLFSSGDYRWTYYGDVRYRFPQLDLTASATFGRFIDDDAGFTLNLRKHFRDVELEMQYRDTDLGKTVLFGGVVPLGPGRRRKPDPVRLRIADRYAHSQRALISDDNAGFVSIASRVGNELPEFDLTDELLNRDRLNAAYVRAHLGKLVQAAGQVAAQGR